jgi:hypothetical protein
VQCSAVKTPQAQGRRPVIVPDTGIVLGAGAVQCSAVQCSAVHCSVVQCSAVQDSRPHSAYRRPRATTVSSPQTFGCFAPSGPHEKSISPPIGPRQAEHAPRFLPYSSGQLWADRAVRAVQGAAACIPVSRPLGHSPGRRRLLWPPRPSLQPPAGRPPAGEREEPASLGPGPGRMGWRTRPPPLARSPPPGAADFPPGICLRSVAWAGTPRAGSSRRRGPCRRSASVAWSDPLLPQAG